ncbi:hypothetical protein MalM25_19760 [Planctomycetes bacterium MalM25]|nr:hypothetical protein MalM25_19760 [Planctomycetes bacterium MalM25]
MATLQQDKSQRRGASVYVAVMGVATIVAMSAITTSTIGRLALRDNRTQAELTQAELNARSGIEHALNWMNRNPDWRQTIGNGVDQPAVLLAEGKTAWRVTDADGSLQDDPRDHAVLRAEGLCGLNDRTVAVMEVDIEPAGRGLGCLDSAVHADGDIYVGSRAKVEGDGTVTANNDIEAVSATFELDASAAGGVSGSDYKGSKASDQSEVESPGEHAFDWYVRRGTQIELSSLTHWFGAYYLEYQVLGRGLNPFGEANPHGVYWIDCEGHSVRLKNLRVHGTLVLLNSPDAYIENTVLMQAEAANYPVLMIEGGLRIDLNRFLVGRVLPEGLLFNYNPPGAPYEGVSDYDAIDFYPARLDGIVYATGVIEISDSSTVGGCLIGSDVVVNSNETLTVEHRDYAANYPPPGFSAGQGVRILPGTWRRVGR